MEQILTLSEELDLAAFAGVNNQNLVCLKNLFPMVRIVARGYQVKLSGADDVVENCQQTIVQLEHFCIQHSTLTEKDIISLAKGVEPVQPSIDNLILHGVNGRPIIARTGTQRQFARAFSTNDLLFAVGPAGSGKTYIAIALAVSALKNKQVRRIILSRPAVEAGEKLGFLPGDMRDKIDPYLQPLYDALQDMIPEQKLQEYMERDIVQIAPLAFIRGRTLNDAVVILDEAQNTTIPQMKMFLTRLGMNSKMIVTGDLTQIDLPQSQRSGLRDSIDKLKGIEGLHISNFTQQDIVRHPLVQRIVDAYEQ